jgi:hypothetical protein
VWAPLDVDSERKSPRDRRVLAVVGLLKPGVTVEAAHAELESIASDLRTENPRTNSEWGVRVVDSLTGRRGPQTLYNLGLLSVGATLVLLIAYMNVALLLLAKSIARQKELKINLILGAGPLRIIRQQIFEGLLVSIPACLLGFAIAWGLILALKASPDPSITGCLLIGGFLGSLCVWRSECQLYLLSYRSCRALSGSRP